MFTHSEKCVGEQPSSKCENTGHISISILGQKIHQVLNNLVCAEVSEFLSMLMKVNISVLWIELFRFASCQNKLQLFIVQ